MKKIYNTICVSFVLFGGLLFAERVLATNVQETQNVNAPTFSKESGYYDAGFQLTLTADPGSQIYYTTDGSIPYVPNGSSGGSSQFPKKEIPQKYTKQIQVKNRQGEANVLCSDANIPMMYTPGFEYNKMFFPKSENVAKATVIRAIAVDGNGNKSSVVTRTYFVGLNIYNKYKNASVISIVTDPDNLLNANTGIYHRNNYQKKGKEWERDAFVEYFEENKSIPFATTMGIRVRGGWSRHYGQKSFNLYFREELGLKNLNYELIPGAKNFENTSKITKYKNFMLRNGGNDTEYTKLQDVFIQSLVNDRAFTTQNSRACVLFLNGEYWGLYSLMEKYSDNYLEEKFGVAKDNVISIEEGELAEGKDGDMQYYSTLKNMAKLDMTKSKNYNKFCKAVDIQSFADFYATQVYIGNTDWPEKNWQIWRTRTKESGNKYADTKWRYMLFDTDFSLNLYNMSGVDFNGIKQAKKDKLFNKVIKNSKFRRLFINTIMDLYNVNFKPSRTNRQLNKYVNIYRPLMAEYYLRFDGSASYSWHFDGNINRMKVFLAARRDNLFDDLKTELKAGRKSAVTFESSYKAVNTITVNTVTANTKSGKIWKSCYTQKCAIPIQAEKISGYIFDGWKVTGGTVSKKRNANTTLTLKSSKATVKAQYRKIGTPPSVKISKLTSKNKTLTVKLKKVSGVEGYQIICAFDKKFKKSMKLVETKKTSAKFKKLKSNKKYYVKARAYKFDEKGQRVYGKYSVIKKKVI